VLAAVLVLAAATPHAHADGAFPDSQQFLLDATQPTNLMLGTNFGLLVSSDDGSHWSWICEQAIASLPFLYSRGPAPASTVYAQSSLGMVLSRDQGCTWQPVGGRLAGHNVLDSFPDPSDPAHVIAIARNPTDGGPAPIALFESRDGGATFGAILLVAPADAVMTGAEIARSAPATIYVTLYSGDGHPLIARSSDSGAHFAMRDLAQMLGNHSVRLAGVDPSDPDTVYLRVVDHNDQLAITHDAGATWQLPLKLAGAGGAPAAMSAFLRLRNGTLLVGSRDGPGAASSDGGKTFAPFATELHLRALAELGDVLYAAADDTRDPFAIGRSHDGGATWQPLLHFAHICGPAACGAAHAACGGPWQQLIARLSIDPAACNAVAVTAPPPRSRASGCDVGGGPAAGGTLAMLGALALLRAHRRRS
jgi:hypothetical protein